ncbi:MAG: hypothetical protein E6Q77_10470 [Rhizobium sp.]|nr:MAG: hypothetical protein E6Q77_10470 [Rhizobium sp.]
MARFPQSMEGDLSSEQADLLQKVIDSIVRQPWYDDSQHSRESLAVRLTFLIQIGIVNAAHLQTIGVSWMAKDVGGNRADATRPASLPSQQRTNH